MKKDKEESLFNEDFNLKESLKFENDFIDDEDLFVEPYQQYLDKLKAQGKLQGHNKSSKKKNKK